MKLPKTSRVVAVLSAATAGAIAYAASTFHWRDTQTAASSGAALATVALIGFLIEHLRPGSPSRWVGVIGLLPPEVGAVVTLGVVFAWWGESAVKVTGFVSAILLPVAAILGVSVAQAKVYSPETATKIAVDVATAKAVDPETHAL